MKEDAAEEAEAETASACEYGLGLLVFLSHA